MGKLVGTRGSVIVEDNDCAGGTARFGWIGRRVGRAEATTGFGPEDRGGGVLARGRHFEQRLNDFKIGLDAGGPQFVAKMLAQSFVRNAEDRGDLRLQHAHEGHARDLETVVGSGCEGAAPMRF